MVGTVVYRPNFREFIIWLERPTGDDFGKAQALFYCPWCGARFPASLRDQLFDELDELADTEVEDYFLALSQAPKRFRSAAWWRGRYDFDGNRIRGK